MNNFNWEDVVARCAALRMAGEHYAALDLVDAALRSPTCRPELLIEKARALLGLGEVLQAGELLDFYLSQLPEDPAALAVLVELEAIIGRRERTKKALGRLLSAQNRTGDQVLAAAKVLLGLGYPGLAAGACFALRHTGEEARLGFAGCLLRAGRIRGAWRAVKRVRRRFPKSAAAVALAGHIQNQGADIKGAWQTWTSIPLQSYGERRLIVGLMLASNFGEPVPGYSKEDLEGQLRRCEAGTDPWYSMGEDDLFPPVGKGLVEGSVIVRADAASIPALRSILVREKLLLPEGKWVGGRRSVVCLANLFGGKGFGLRLFLFLMLLRDEAVRAGGLVLVVARPGDREACTALHAFAPFFPSMRPALQRHLPTFCQPRANGAYRFWPRLNILAERAGHCLFRDSVLVGNLLVTQDKGQAASPETTITVGAFPAPGAIERASDPERTFLGPVRETSGGYFVIKEGTGQLMKITGGKP